MTIHEIYQNVPLCGETCIYNSYSRFEQNLHIKRRCRVLRLSANINNVGKQLLSSCSRYAKTFQGGTAVVVPYCYLFLLSVFILWFTYYVSDIFKLGLGSWMTTCLGKSCSFGLPRVPFVNCCQFMYLVISLLVLRAGYGIWLCQFLIIAYLFTLFHSVPLFYVAEL